MIKKVSPDRASCRNLRVVVFNPALVMSALTSLSAVAGTPCPPALVALDDGILVGGSQNCPLPPGGGSNTPVPQGGISDTPDYKDPMASCSGLDVRRSVSVTNASALQQALANATCGDTIRLAPGTYATSFSIDENCPMTAPVIVQGAPGFESTVTSGVTLNGSRNIITGINFVGPDARVRLGGTNNKVIANRFTDWRFIAVTAVTGKQGEIAYNELSEPHPWLASEVGTYPYRAGIRSSEKDASTFHFDAWIHDNYFHDFPAKPDADNYDSGQSDAIEVCETNREWTYLTPAGWYIERNLIRKHMQGYGLVDLKCSGVVVRGNTVTESTGRIDIRYGVGSTLESNWQEGAGGGSTINGGNHRVIGNYMRGGGIALMSGNQPWDFGSAAGSTHNQAYQVLVAGNDTDTLKVGVTYSSDMETYPTTGTVIEGHKGSGPALLSQQGTTVRSSTNVQFVPPIKLIPGDVGPSALNQASATYLQCRRP